MNKPAKMRSSIACVRCRRSKVKCVNNGMNTTCRTCDSQGRECTYPVPASGTSSTPKRTETNGGMPLDGEVETKRARKKEPDTGRKSSIRGVDDPLGTPSITFAQWKEIYSLFVLHFSTDLPFLHEATFFDRIIASVDGRSSETQILLLGILSLTARFVPELVAYPYPSTRVSPSGSGDPKLGQPLYASEFYAHALEDRLDAVTLATPSLDTIQSLLMLGLYSWGMCRGMRSWMWVGTATRMAYAMGLSTEELSPYPLSKDTEIQTELQLLGVKEKRTPTLDTQGLVFREIKRRTMWSCFMLDRYLSSGRARPQMSVSSLDIQLPCSEEDFRFGSNVKTDRLEEGGGLDKKRGVEFSGKGHFAQVESTPVLGIYIRLVEIWGGISKWSCAGGRREEKHPPWDKASRFYKLRKQLEDFKASLPPKLTFTPSNLAAHVGGTAMSVYSSIHASYFLCQIVLHREYIPFIPLRCQNGPAGPLDEPTFPKHAVPPGFWEKSAELIFEGARSIIDIVKANESRRYLIEAPQVMFSIWTSCFVGIYALHFPWMDPGRHMCDSPYPDRDEVRNHGGREASSFARQALGQMMTRMRMASNWHRAAARFNKYFAGLKRHYDEAQLLANVRNPQDRKLSLREGGHGMGGGLAVYKAIERELKEFGALDEDDEPFWSDVHERGSSRASTSGPGATPTIKSEGMQGIERTLTGRPNSEGGWAAVNSGAPSGGADLYSQHTTSVPYKTLGPSPHSGSFSSSDQGFGGMTSNSPSLVNGQHANPTSNNLSSPYGRPDLTASASFHHPSAEPAYPNDTQQHSHQMAVYPSSAGHTQPLLENPDNQMGYYTYDPSQFQDNLAQAEAVRWDGADVSYFRNGTPLDLWGPDLVQGPFRDNFMQRVFKPHQFSGLGNAT